MSLRRCRLGAIGIVLAILVGGCGGSSSPADKVPALETRLASVDAAVAAGDDARVRAALAALTDTVAKARKGGDLTAEEADAITAAAADLLAELPEESSTGSSPASPQATPTSPSSTPTSETSSPAPEHEKGHEKGGKKGHKKGHDKGR